MKKNLVLRSLSLSFVFIFGLMLNSSAWNGPYFGNQDGRSEETRVDRRSFIDRLNSTLDSETMINAFNCITDILSGTIHANELLELLEFIRNRDFLTIDEFNNIHQLYDLLGFSHELDHSEAIIELYRLLDFNTGTNFSVEYALGVMIFRTSFSLGEGFYNNMIERYNVDILELLTSFIDILISQRSEDLNHIDNMLRFVCSINTNYNQDELRGYLLDYIHETFYNIDLDLYVPAPFVSEYIIRINNYFDSESL